MLPLVYSTIFGVLRILSWIPLNLIVQPSKLIETFWFLVSSSGGDNKNFLSIKTDGAEYGEDIVAFGYPVANELSTSVKLTRGIVSSLSGPGNNY